MSVPGGVVGPGSHSRRRVSSNVVHEFNRRTAHNTERYVITHLQSRRIERSVREAAKTRALPKLDHAVVRRQLARYLTKQSGDAGTKG